ncbi:MAG: DUF1772 domain-containing protein [Verrucomicrobia bacterium]|nr:DUF1772 domain-containing protein [Verrucomicrobiota bacterium]MBV9674158.1 DUF1772 domain-containing protein [Verrucomicrobiota bacterium]
MLELIALVVSGFVACADFGLWLFVYPVIRHLPPRYRIEVEQRFFKRFGRITPFLVTAPFACILLYAFRFTRNSVANKEVWGSLFFFGAALALTIWLDEPANQSLKEWNPEIPPPDWQQTRWQWAIAFGTRVFSQMAGFVLLCLAIANR